MKSARLLSLLPLLFAACGVSYEWNELRTTPMTVAACYDGIEYVATSGGLIPDVPSCDRGLATWQSRWRIVQRRPFGIGRFRLRAEILLEEGSSAEGWIVRYVFEQQKVKDPRNERDPTEDDWVDDGQDREAESLFGERLRRRMGAGT